MRSRYGSYPDTDMDLESPGGTDGVEEILVAAQLGLFELVIDYADDPPVLAASLHRVGYVVTLESRGPNDIRAPGIVRISWAATR